MTRDQPGARLATYGSGRLIAETVRQLPASPHELVAAVVHSPQRAGKDLGHLVGLEPVGVETSADLAGVLAGAGVEVMLYGGVLGDTHLEVMQRCAEAGVDLVHTCFAHPGAWMEEPARERLAASAAASGARILGTGLLPGLKTDVLPALIATGMPDPVRVTVRVVSDLSAWGDLVLKEELGVGGTEAGTAWRFDAIMRESVLELAEALHVQVDEIRTDGGLLMAPAPVQIGSFAVAAGQVEGFDQHATAMVGGERRFDVSWLALPAPETRGLERSIHLSLVGGDEQPVELKVNGTEDPYPGTAARMLKSIAPLRRMPAGIHLPAQIAVI